MRRLLLIPAAVLVFGCDGSALSSDAPLSPDVNLLDSLGIRPGLWVSEVADATSRETVEECILPQDSRPSELLLPGISFEVSSCSQSTKIETSSVQFSAQCSVPGAYDVKASYIGQYTAERLSGRFVLKGSSQRIDEPVDLDARVESRYAGPCNVGDLRP
ncbi:DUF3617 family protein [Pseudoblastomonas marina]|uniref:DUF3617 family protein n=1 Tax=Blastomonas marina TaxID=1867408 RepID=UPI003899088A